MCVLIASERDKINGLVMLLLYSRLNDLYQHCMGVRGGGYWMSMLGFIYIVVIPIAMYSFLNILKYHKLVFKAMLC